MTVKEAGVEDLSETRVALVTGGGTGIGAACCRALAAEGFRVGVHYRSSEEAALKLVAELYNEVFNPPEDEEFFRRRFEGRHNVSMLVAMLEDRHVLGHCPRDTWLLMIGVAGLTPPARPYDGSTFEPPAMGELFLGVRE